VGAQKKARQWTESGKISAEKIDRTVKTKKTHETNREKQYRKILKQIQGNPTKTKYKGKSKQNKIKETKYRETKENIKQKQNDQLEKAQA
jgi:aminopeptidase N